MRLPAIKPNAPDAASFGPPTGQTAGRAPPWPLVAALRSWWRRQSPARQDRFAFIGPLLAVLLFLAAIAFAFWYLRVEEMEREQEAVRRDLEYGQQQMRLRLIDRQEQLMGLAREIANRSVDAAEFGQRSEALLVQHPELQSVTWINARRRVVAGEAAAAVPVSARMVAGEIMRAPETDATFTLARDLRQPVYSQPSQGTDNTCLLYTSHNAPPAPPSGPGPPP